MRTDGADPSQGGAPDSGVPESPTPRRRSKGWAALRAAVTLSLLGWLLYTIDLRALWALLLSAKALPVLLLLAILFSQRVLGAYRWWILVRCNHPGVRFREIIRIAFASDFAGQFLPGAVGMELLRIIGLSRVTADPAGAFSSVAMDRLLSLAGLAVLVLAALAAAPATLDADGRLALAGWAFLAGVVGAGILVMHPRARAAFEALLPGPIARRVESKLQKIYTSLDAYKGRPVLAIWAMLIAVVFQALRVGIFWAGAVALGIQTPFIYFLVFIPIVILVTLLPISVGGFGVREAAFLYLFGQVGMGAEEAVALSLFVQLIVMTSSIPGAWFCITAPRRPADGAAQAGPAAATPTGGVL